LLFSLTILETGGDELGEPGGIGVGGTGRGASVRATLVAQTTSQVVAATKLERGEGRFRAYFFEAPLAADFAAVFFLVDLAADFRVVLLEPLLFVPLLLASPAPPARFSFLM
jgi:hypothetical protein